MAPLSRWLAPVRQIASALFQQDVTLKRRDDGQLHVVLAERRAPERTTKVDRTESERRRRHEEAMLVRTELAALLNELPETRSTMRHLVFVEQAIAKKGLKVLHKVPLDVLQRAHEQLENLVVNWSAPGLANLRSKMAVAIIDREHMDPNAEADAYRTAAVAERADDAGDDDGDSLPALPVGEAAPPDDESALAAAYAALGDLAPTGHGGLDTIDGPLLEMQGELGSASAKALRTMPGAFDDKPAEISIRVLQP
ncbi:MAG: hypothetical protein KIT17_15370 [Rubrivivax sp.]|nr:hypothetical protein [Rubrivivax sp.]